MSAKNLDRHNRWRSKTVAFRVSPEEDAQIETAVRLSGLTKQDYITRRLLCREIVVQGNPRVYKALRNELNSVLEELKRIEAGQSIDGEQLETIRLPLRWTVCGRIDRWILNKRKRLPYIRLLAQTEDSRSQKNLVKV